MSIENVCKTVEAKEMDNAQHLHMLIQRKGDGSCSLGNQFTIYS